MHIQGLQGRVHPGSVAYPLACAVAAVAGYCLFRLLVLARRRSVPLPPGPPGEFLLGHYRAVPDDAPFKRYAEWGKEYSKCVSETGLLWDAIR